MQPAIAQMSINEPNDLMDLSTLVFMAIHAGFHGNPPL
jgi:hypothetical protein